MSKAPPVVGVFSRSEPRMFRGAGNCATGPDSQVVPEPAEPPTP
ncbi:hypothetical protein OG896_27980 [Streptomyces sp. NBC_00669]|nr:hypothetical protein [Streptomyces sp. NBC_00669]